MNDLFSRSFKNHVNLKEDSRKDLEAGYDVEMVGINEEKNLGQFFEEVKDVKNDMESVEGLSRKLQASHEESKTIHNAKTIKNLRDTMDKDVEAVLKKSKLIKGKLEALDKANIASRRLPGSDLMLLEFFFVCSLFPGYCQARYTKAETVKKYPAPLSQTSIISILGSIQTAVLITILDRGIKPTSWVLDRSGIFTFVFGGISCNGLGLALQLWCMQKRGPLFVSIFSPVSTVFSAILSSLFLGDTMHLGSMIGILLIFGGLYLVLWGKSKDSVTHITISPQKEEDLHTADEEQYEHPSSSQVLDVKAPLLR